MLHPVILSGGSGRRLWPASRPHRPKPFLPLIGGRTTFLGALERASALPGAAPVTVVAGRRHELQVRQALAGTPADLVMEPEPRDTAPAAAAAALILHQRDADAILLFLPADHFIPDTAAFVEAALAASRIAREGWIVTLGLPPTANSSAYGYIRPAADGHRVAAFIEKPDAARAEALIRDGCLWNCGVFVCRADVLLGETGRHAPKVLAAARKAVVQARAADGAIALGDAFLAAPRVSLDVAVMERTDRAGVVRASFAWSDLGAWDAVLAASERDAAGNSTDGAVVLEAASDCLVRAAQGITVAVVGARNLAVIVDREAVMICDLGAADHLRAAVDRVSAEPR